MKNASGLIQINYPTSLRSLGEIIFFLDYSAVTLASTIINNYPLANASQYAAMFGGDADTSEVIWKFDNVQGSNNSVDKFFDGDFIEASRELREAFSSGDILEILLL